jgi:hypothetical protein
MPKAAIKLSAHANRVVNAVKARDGLKNTSQAIDQIVAEYGDEILGWEFRPEFVEEVRRIRKGEFRKARSVDEILR